jgi:hypothetical protein
MTNELQALRDYLAADTTTANDFTNLKNHEDDSSTNIRRFNDYLKTAKPAIHGEKGDDQTVHVAREGWL